MITSNLGDKYSSNNLVKAMVELYDGSTLAHTCTCGKFLSDFTISREGEMGKFFGFGICHKLQMKLIDLEKELRVYEGYSAKICFGDGTIWDCPYPDLDVTDVKVDKKSGDISVTAYDVLYKAAEYQYSDLNLTAPYTIRALTTAIANLLGISVIGMDSTFDLSYTEGANYNDDDNLRLILNHIAEATQTIYYVNNKNQLVFKRLTNTSVASYQRKDYYEFETAETKILKAICNATELGDNLILEDESIPKGVTQYVRDNGLWEVRTDISDLLSSALNRVAGFELIQFELDWSGDYRLEIGDCITIYYDDDATNVYILSDVITYGGTINEISSWQFTDNDAETFANPVNIGDKINQTFARVDKIEKEITLYVGDEVKNAVNQLVPEKVEELTEGLVTDVEGLKATQTTLEQNMAQLTLNTEGIEQRVQSNEQTITTLEGTIPAAKNEAITEANKYTDQKVNGVITTLNTKVAEIKVTTDGITQRVTSQENKTVEIESDVAELNGKTTTLEENMSELELADNSIIASVETLKQSTKSSLGGINEELSSLNQKVSTKVTSEEVEIKIQETLSNGVDKVTTATGFTFDDEGLHISKSDSHVSSTLDETGLEVSRSGTEVLTAKEEGVNALNLTARQYLSVESCRFETYGYNRMGCYWIGG